MSFVETFSDKTVTSSKSTAFMTYPNLSMLLHISLKERQLMIDDGGILVGCPSVRCNGDEVEEK